MKEDLDVKAKVVADLLAERLAEKYLIPILDKYKATVFNILVEEENKESLAIIAEHLITSSSKSADSIIH